jgi:probable selenium-dependent hydroxylase accessory protein YqeC
MGIDAVGSRLDEAVHRVEVAERFTGLAGDHILTPKDCATILTHPDGALRVSPASSRVLVGITKISSAAEAAGAAAVAEHVHKHPRIADCVHLGS